MEKGGKGVENFDKYTEKMWATFSESTRKYSKDGEKLDYVLIIDLEGYNSQQATSIPGNFSYTNIHILLT